MKQTKTSTTKPAEQSTKLVKKNSNKIGLKYSTTQIREVLDLISDGLKVKDALVKVGISWRTFRNYLDRDKTGKLHDDYLQARSLGVDFTLTELDEMFEDLLKESKTKDIKLGRMKLIESYMKHKHFVASKISGKLYGSDKDRMAIQTNSNGDTKIVVEWER